jgi:acyl-coenzyme A thioesterase PaaI-like protein
VEYKVNFLAPAKGDRFLARGEVVRPGATVTVCKGDVLAYDGGEEKLVATMLMTMMTMPNRPNLTG